MMSTSDQSATHPCVSCVCVTEKRAEKLRRAIACFASQTYPHRELVVLCPSDDHQTLRVLEACGGDVRLHVRKLQPEEALTLGERRNLAIAEAHGEYFCLWDDDDWYHPRRIEAQLTAARSYHKAACLLTYVLLFDTETRRAYLSQMRLWEGSVLCHRSVIGGSLQYEAERIVEDSAFVNSLVDGRLVYPLAAPNLYVYERHGGNTSGRRLSKLLFDRGQELSPATSELLGKVMSLSYGSERAVEFMDSRALLEELDYFRGMTVNVPSKQLERFRRYLLGSDD